MIIGLLTYHAACNFGANLQVLSTYGYLKKQGHHPIIIDWFTAELENNYLKQTPKEQVEVHLLFRQSHFETTRRCYNAEEIAKEITRNGIEAVIIGSDAVAQHHPFLERLIFPCRKVIAVQKMTSDRLFPNPFWGTFLDYLDKPIPVSIMSASNQNSEFRKMSITERRLMRIRVERFKYISTRDTWTSEMYAYITNGKIRPKVTPDPVFAFNQNVDCIPSESEIREKYHLSNKYYLFSFHHSKTVSKEWLNEIQRLANQDDIDCVALPFPAGVNFEHPFKKKIDIPLDPLDWYALLKYSAGFIGHNMHPIVICLHNSVPCFSFDHYGIVKWRFWVNEKSSKIFHIMNSFGVSQNRICCIGKKTNIPTPEFVINKLREFDRSIVKRYAEEYLNQYNLMMKKIIDSSYEK